MPVMQYFVVMTRSFLQYDVSEQNNQLVQLIPDYSP